VCLTSVLIGVGLIAVLSPSALLRQDRVHFEITASRKLLLALAVLLISVNVYMVTKRLDLRRVRGNLISTTIQSELVRLQSFTDPLTEVYNRRSLDEMAGRFISRAMRTHRPLTFLLIDVDRFKEVNTRFGHLGGDMALAEIASLLKSSTRGSDAVVRYGGDEFLVILADTCQADKVVERIKSYVREWNRAGNLDDFELSLSIGVAQWSDGKTLDEILDLADHDMYAAKAASKVQPTTAT
jgi:diguanylate cyclase (GGDEF)-like protein